VGEALERSLAYAVGGLFDGLQREFGWWKVILIILGISVGLMIAAALARMTLELGKVLVKTWPRASREVRGFVILAVLSTVGVLLALAEMPYSYYMMLRVLVCLTSVVALAKARKTHLELWQWVFGVIAALYNPFLPVHLGDKDLWALINFVTVVLFWSGEYRIAAVLVGSESSLISRLYQGLH